MESPNATAPATTSAISIRYGLLLGLVSVVFSLVMFMTASEQSPLRWTGLLFSVGAIWLAHRDFKKHHDGYMEYGQGLGIAVLLNVVSGTISSIFTFVYLEFIDNSMIQRIMDKTRADMEARGMEDAQIDQALEMSAKFTTPTMMVVFGILGAAFFGLLLGLIISAITKNSRPEFE